MIPSKIYIKGCLTLFAASAVMCCTSCVNDDPSEIEKASMTVHFGVRAVNDENAVEGEGMKTLQVYLVNNKSKEVVREWSGEVGTDVYEKNITFKDLTSGETYCVYAIANAPQNYNFKEDFKGTPSLNYVLYDNSEEDEKADSYVSSGKGIPMTGKKLEITLNGKDEQVELELVRAVAKARFTLVNEYGEDITIKKIEFGQFIPYCAKLWTDNGENAFSTLANKNVTTFTYEEPITAPAATMQNPDGNRKTIPVLAYFYESSGLNDAYKLTLTNSYGKTFEWKLSEADTPITEIKRNTCLDMTVTVYKPSEVTLTYEVVDWTEKTIDVPSFQ